jgi:hypothetical protein
MNPVNQLRLDLYNMTIIKESLDYMDMVGQIEPKVSVDEYAAKMGPDHEVVTLSFIVKSSLAGEDLVSWFEKGYDFVLDASTSEGELAPGKYVVFVEMDRRSKVPQRIIEMLTDLETLTDMPVNEWQVKIDDEEYPVSEDIIREKVILNPNVYKAEKNKDNELNEMRKAAGLEPKKLYDSKDALLKNFIMAAGL